jgi:hypothetical protein
MASSYLQERRKKIKTKELAHRQRLGSKWMIQGNAKQNLAGIIYVYRLYTVFTGFLQLVTWLASSCSTCGSQYQTLSPSLVSPALGNSPGTRLDNLAALADQLPTSGDSF